MIDLGRRSTTDFKTAHAAEEARERRWESTFFMINVIFLLILFFIVAANFDVHMQVTPPKSDAANALPPDAPQLTVTAEAKLFLNGKDVTGTPLKQALLAAGTGTALKIAADAKAEAVAIAKLIDEAGDAGVTRIAIVTVSRR
ncbi:MAG TPA: biopolymer transporter ExbD [Gammaproteobacteria bacterium]|nr:biopolymer transporter ExbD [Gammaproteobacteria bacterium]